MNIKVKKHLLLYKGYKLKCCIGKSGLTEFKKEGDLSTPRGTFGLGLLYYRKDRIKIPKCKLKKRVIKKNMGWCNDRKSKKYNREISFPFKFSAERLYRKDKIYDLFNKTIKKGNFIATYDKTAYSYADVIIVDVNLDVDKIAS